MLRNIALCLSVVCLAQAAFLDLRSNGQPPQPPANGGNDITPADLADEIKGAQDKLKGLLGNLNGLTAKVMKGDKQDSDWIDIMTHMADFMKGGFGFFMESITTVSHLTESMFKGDHDFDQVTRCTNLAESVDGPDFGKPEFLVNMEVALTKDLMCFSNMLKEVTVLKFRPHPACPPSEDDVIDFVASTFKDLFRLRNDGERFFHAVNKAVERYSDKVNGLHDHLTTELQTREVLAQLIQALKKQ